MILVENSRRAIYFGIYMYIWQLVNVEHKAQKHGV